MRGICREYHGINHNLQDWEQISKHFYKMKPFTLPRNYPWRRQATCCPTWDAYIHILYVHTQATVAVRPQGRIVVADYNQMYYVAGTTVRDVFEGYATKQANLLHKEFMDFRFLFLLLWREGYFCWWSSNKMCKLWWDEPDDSPRETLVWAGESCWIFMWLLVTKQVPQRVLSNH